MHVGIAYLWWRGKRSRHSRRMRIRNYTYLVRGPLAMKAEFYHRDNLSMMRIFHECYFHITAPLCREAASKATSPHSQTVLWSWDVLSQYHGLIVSQITGNSTVCLTACSEGQQRKHQSSILLAICEGNQPITMDSLHKAPVMQNVVPCHYVIMFIWNKWLLDETVDWFVKLDALIIIWHYYVMIFFF